MARFDFPNRSAPTTTVIITPLESLPSSRPVRFFQSRQMTPGGRAIVGDLAPPVQFIELVIKHLAEADKTALLNFIQNQANGAVNTFDFTDDTNVQYDACRFWFDDIDCAQTSPQRSSENLRLAGGI